MKSGLRTAIAFAFLCLTLSPNARGSEQIERYSTMFKTENLYDLQRFADLEKLSAQYRNSQSRTASGLWNLTLFYSGIDEAFSDNESEHKKPDFWPKAEKRAQNWLDQYPDSPTAQLAYAKMLFNRAFSRSSEKRTLAELQQVRVYLEAHKKTASVDPHWYELMETIATIQNWAEPEFHRLIDEGIARHPRFYQIYFKAADYYRPLAGGDAGLVEDFAKEALEKTKAEEGFGMYARIYWYVYQVEYHERLFSDSLVDWPTMKKGMDEVLKKYPDPWNLNNFAILACLAKDKAKTAELLDRIEDDPLDEVWGMPSFFEPCKNWALGKRGSL